MITIAIPGLRLESIANKREHWYERRLREGRQRHAVMIHLCLFKGTSGHRTAPGRVMFCRIGPRMLDDDNLAASFRAIRDEVAAFYEVDDGPKGPIAWGYEQRSGEYGIEIGLEVTGG